MSRFHRRYLSLVAEIETSLPVREWRYGDLDLWPVARMALHLDMHRQAYGEKAPVEAGRVHRVLAALTRLPRNIWRSRRDLRHLLLWPKRAHAVFLGDGVSLDCPDGAFVDRFCEPLMTAYERRSLSCFLMQRGDLCRLPWLRPTFPANLVEALAQLSDPWHGARMTLPGHEDVLALIASRGIRAPGLGWKALAEQARHLYAAAWWLEKLLARVLPQVAFVVTYYAGIAPAFLLACRRRGVLSVDLQHCPQGGTHKAYGWDGVPRAGYNTLPDLFWTWTEAEADFISAKAGPQAFCGGHVQMARYNQLPPLAFSKDGFVREILVALQPIPGHAALWDRLAQIMIAAPSDWRWWIRRHPSERGEQAQNYGRLLSLSDARFCVGQASRRPLPELLVQMTAMVSLASGAAGEAEMMGVPAFFLDEDAADVFGAMIVRGAAKIVPLDRLTLEIAALPAAAVRPMPAVPDLDHGLDEIARRAREYADRAVTA